MWAAQEEGSHPTSSRHTAVGDGAAKIPRNLPRFDGIDDATVEEVLKYEDLRSCAFGPEYFRGAKWGAAISGGISLAAGIRSWRRATRLCPKGKTVWQTDMAAAGMMLACTGVAAMKFVKWVASRSRHLEFLWEEHYAERALAEASALTEKDNTVGAVAKSGTPGDSAADLLADVERLSFMMAMKQRAVALANVGGGSGRLDDSHAQQGGQTSLTQSMLTANAPNAGSRMGGRDGQHVLSPSSSSPPMLVSSSSFVLSRVRSGAWLNISDHHGPPRRRDTCDGAPPPRRSLWPPRVASALVDAATRLAAGIDRPVALLLQRQPTAAEAATDIHCLVEDGRVGDADPYSPSLVLRSGATMRPSDVGSHTALEAELDRERAAAARQKQRPRPQPVAASWNLVSWVLPSAASSAEAPAAASRLSSAGFGSASYAADESHRGMPNFWDGFAVGVFGSLQDSYHPVKPPQRYLNMTGGKLL